MKSIKEKAEAYDKVLEWATEAHKVCDGMLKEDLEHLFPELKESEDERIRKELLQIVKENEDSFYMVMTPNKREKLIAWLEKQESLQTNNPNLKWSKEAIKVMDDIVKDKEIEFGSSDNPAESSRLANEYNLLTIL